MYTKVVVSLYLTSIHEPNEVRVYTRTDPTDLDKRMGKGYIFSPVISQQITQFALQVASVDSYQDRNSGQIE